MSSSSIVDFRTLPINTPSLCIPRVFSNIDEKRIRYIFDELNMGIIERVDIVSKTTEKGDKFNRVFVHFKRWFSNSNADTARERLLNGKEIKIIYDDPWFWKVSAYREVYYPTKPHPQKHNQQNHNQQEKKKVTIQFDDDIKDDKFGHSKTQRQEPRPRPRPTNPTLSRGKNVKTFVPRSKSFTPQGENIDIDIDIDIGI